jgi:hypothetical protein
LSILIAMLGCGPSAGGDDDGAGEGDSTTAGTGEGSASVSASSAESTTAPGDDTSATAESGVTNVDTGVDDDADDDDADDGDKLDIAGGCDFETIVCDAAEGSKMPPVDCGFVTLADDVQAWRTAHQCASEAFASQSAVKVLWEMQGIDSTLYGALVGFVGEVYAVSEYGYDSFGGPILWTRSCDGVVTLDDCAVGVGEMCLTCSGPGDQAPLCE